MRYQDDPRVVLTLDAGGTKVQFSALRGGREIAEPLTLSSEAPDLETFLGRIVSGFEEVKRSLDAPPVAISFAFPGPADYEHGVIGDLWNMPVFKGGVALGPFLEDHFGVPVFINNDGDLFAYGEALGGFLPWINGRLAEAGNPKRFRNLVGLTFGTGFGGGMVLDGRLHMGDNGAGAEVWLLRNKLDPTWTSEEGVSIRAVRRGYAREACIPLEACPDPKTIFEIGMGLRTGHRAAACETYRRLGEVAGDAVANLLTIVDGLVVIGGGLSGAAPLFMPALMAELNGRIARADAGEVPRMEIRAHNAGDPADLSIFLETSPQGVTVPGSGKRVPYEPCKRCCVGITRLGTSAAAHLGAYAFALEKL